MPNETFSRETMTRIYRLKRDLLEFKRAVSPLVDVCNRLMRFDLPVIPEDTRPYFRDALTSCRPSQMLCETGFSR